LPAGARGAGVAEDATFDGQYRIKLDAFEGPLDLLLHLIQQHELDILDIPVSFITSKYLEYLKLMQVLSIEIASEYLVMAATLVHIKSKMLLPSVPSGQDDGIPQEEAEDPRAELVRRLLEYQKYKAAAAELAERGTLGRDVFPRGFEEQPAPGPTSFAKVEVFGLLEAFEKVLKRTNVKLDHEVVFDRISITDRIVELTEKLEGRRAVRFEWLFLSANRSGPVTRFDLVITFLAMLEMCRMRLLRVYQTGPLAPIYMGLEEGKADDLSEEERTIADRDADAKLSEAAVVEPPVAKAVEPQEEPEEGAPSERSAIEAALVEAPVIDESVAAEQGGASMLGGPVVEERGEALAAEGPAAEERTEQSEEPVVEEPVANGWTEQGEAAANPPADETGAELPPSEDPLSVSSNEDAEDEVGLETIADRSCETVTELPYELEAESEPERETMPMPPPGDAESERATIPVEAPSEHAPPMAVHIPPNPAWRPDPGMLPAGTDDAPTPPDEVTDEG